MAQYCHASHEVYHEGVAQRAHNLSPVPFGAAKRAKESSYHCSDTASQSIRPGGEGTQKGEKRLANICVKRAVQMHVLCVLDRRTASARVPVVYGAAFSADRRKIAAGDAARVPALHIPGAGAEEPCALGVCGPEVICDELVA